MKLKSALDYNTQSEYKLTIIATDQALLILERRTGSFVLTINVNDINNNPPVLDSIGAQSLEENLPSGSIVFTVSATDLDEGLTVPLTFSITVNYLTSYPIKYYFSVIYRLNNYIHVVGMQHKSLSLNIQSMIFILALTLVTFFEFLAFYLLI